MKAVAEKLTSTLEGLGLTSFGAVGEDFDPSLHEAVATLWLGYAQFLAAAKQYRSSMEAYEQASQCPIARNFGRVWLEYARFAIERNRRYGYIYGCRRIDFVGLSYNTTIRLV